MEPGGNSEQKNNVKIFFCINSNCIAQLRRVVLNFQYHFCTQRENSEQNGNVQIFFYINSNCVFIRPYVEKNPIVQWRRVGICDIISGTGGWISEQNGNVQIISTYTQIVYFLKPFEEKNPLAPVPD